MLRSCSIGLQFRENWIIICRSITKVTDVNRYQKSTGIWSENEDHIQPKQSDFFCGRKVAAKWHIWMRDDTLHSREVSGFGLNQKLQLCNSFLAGVTAVVSALDVIFNVMHSINPRFTYLLTHVNASSRPGFHTTTQLLDNSRCNPFNDIAANRCAGTIFWLGRGSCS